MLPYNFNAGPESLRYLSIAEKLLGNRDFAGSKTYATRARESDPRLEQSDQIIAIADTLIASEKQIGNQHLDWYAILQLARRTTDSELIASQYRRLAVLLNPNRNNFPYAEHAYKLVCEAWLVLSNSSRKFEFDSQISGGSNNQTQFNFIQSHFETPQPEQQHNGTTQFNFMQEHSEQLHQSSSEMQEQQQFMHPYGNQELFPNQPVEYLNQQQPLSQQQHWLNQSEQHLSRPQSEQHLWRPQSEQHLSRPQAQQSQHQPQQQQQQSLHWSQVQPQQPLPWQQQQQQQLQQQPLPWQQQQPLPWQQTQAQAPLARTQAQQFLPHHSPPPQPQQFLPQQQPPLSKHDPLPWQHSQPHQHSALQQQPPPEQPSRQATPPPPQKHMRQPTPPPSKPQQPLHQPTPPPQKPQQPLRQPTPPPQKPLRQPTPQPQMYVHQPTPQKPLLQPIPPPSKPLHQPTPPPSKPLRQPTSPPQKPTSPPPKPLRQPTPPHQPQLHLPKHQPQAQAQAQQPLPWHQPKPKQVLPHSPPVHQQQQPLPQTQPSLPKPQPLLQPREQSPIPKPQPPLPGPQKLQHSPQYQTQTQSEAQPQPQLPLASQPSLKSQKQSPLPKPQLPLVSQPSLKSREQSPLPKSQLPLPMPQPDLPVPQILQRSQQCQPQSQLEPIPQPQLIPQPHQQPQSQSQSEPTNSPANPQEQGEIGRSQEQHRITGNNSGDTDSIPQNDVSTFWTACPYCYNMYEYPVAYAGCTLRCQNCRRAFHAAKVCTPPLEAEDKEAYFCCWGFFPLGISQSNLEKNKAGVSTWTPISPMFALSQGVNGWNVRKQKNEFANAGPDVNMRKDEWTNAGPDIENRNKEWTNADPDVNKRKNKRTNAGPRTYIDDDQDSILDISSNEDSDEDWHSTKKKNAKSPKKKVSASKRVKRSGEEVSKKVRKSNIGNLQTGRAAEVERSVNVPNTSVPSMPVDETSNGAASVITRKQPGRTAKELGKLDLNVEFNNEVEEPAQGTSGGSKAGPGVEDNIEGIGFFEDLDEFLNSLPILSVDGDDKVKDG